MTHERTTVTAALLCASLFLTSCGGGDDDAGAAPSGGMPAVTVTAAQRQDADNLFKTLCSTCHGTTGTGDGPASAGLDPKPRSFGDKEWQASIDDEHIRKVITLGGAAVGKSVNMPPQPQLKSQPGVLQALVEVVRKYGK